MNKTICIVGAGPGGICAARRCHEEGFSKIAVFEQSNTVGGLWNYTNETGVHSSMYKNLRTNTIKELAAFKDFPIPDYNQTGRSFITQEEYLKYLNEFAKPIRSFIKFKHEVTYVTRKNDKWLVTVKNLKNNETSIHEFDVVFICNGVNTKPYYPKFVNKYKRPYMHSHDYREAEKYKGKTVVIVGGGPTGVDICEQLLPHVEKVYILYELLHGMPKEFPENVVQLPSLIDTDENTLFLADGCTLENIDLVIFCTGYIYDFPFLDKSIIQVKYDEKMVSPLFMHMAHRDYLDSFFLLGLNYYVFAPLAFEVQVRFAIALMKGEATGFAKEDVEQWEERRIKQLSDAGHTNRHFHFFEYPKDLHQWEYYDQLSKYSNTENWIPKVYEKMGFHNTGAWYTTPFEFRKYNYKILNDEEFEVVKIDGL